MLCSCAQLADDIEFSSIYCGAFPAELGNYLHIPVEVLKELNGKTIFGNG